MRKCARQGLLILGLAVCLAFTFDFGRSRPVPAPGKRSAQPAVISMRVKLSPFAGDFSAVDFWNQDVGWACASDGIYRTVDGGASFARVYPVFNLEASGIQVMSAADVWVFGYGTLLRTIDGGNTWSSLPFLPHQGNVTDIAFRTTSRGYAVTGSVSAGGTRVWKTADGGRTWEPCRAPAGTSGISFSDARHGFLLTGAGGLCRTTDGGRTWTKTQTLPKSKGGSPASGRLVAAGPRDAWLLLFGSAGMSQGSYAIFHTGDGTHWKPVLGVSTAGAGPAPGGAQSAPRGPGLSPGALAIAGRQTAYVAGGCEACGAGTVQVDGTEDGGRSWSHGAVIYGSGSDLYNYWSLSFPSVMDGWLATQTGILHTADGGKTWRQVFPRPSLTPLVASFVSASLGYGLGIVGDASAVLRTMDGGRDWSLAGYLPVHPKPGNPWTWQAGSSMSFASAQDGFATLYGRLYRTRDGGYHWWPVKLPDKTGNGYAWVQFVSASAGVVSQPDYAGPQPVWVTRDGGRTWRAVSGSALTAVLGLLEPSLRKSVTDFVSSGQTTLAGVWDNRVAWLTLPQGLRITTDGGRTWTVLSFPTAFQGLQTVASVQFVSPRAGWLRTAEGDWYRTMDGGRDWVWQG